MTTKQHFGATVSATLPPDFALPDPPRIPDMQQNAQLRRIESALDGHFKRRGDVLVSGQGYLRHDPMNDGERYAPDCVVTFGVDAKAIVRRNGYIISEVGKPPDFVLEIASQSTGRNDYTYKREAYERYKALEYWRSDETGGRWHDAALAGDRLVDGKYVPIEIIRDEDGRFWGYSEVLDLHLCWDKGILRFYDEVSDRFLPDSVELSDERDEAEARARAAEVRSRADKARADEAEARSRADRARADDAEAEINRLRELLRLRE